MVGCEIKAGVGRTGNEATACPLRLQFLRMHGQGAYFDSGTFYDFKYLYPLDLCIVVAKVPWLATVIFLCQVDGEEDIKAGLDLHEMAEVLLQMGIWQAAVSYSNSMQKYNMPEATTLFLCSSLYFPSGLHGSHASTIIIATPGSHAPNLYFCIL